MADSSGGTVMNIPASRINNQETAVRVLEHIREMQIRVLRGDEVKALHRKRGSLWRQTMSDDLTSVVLRREQAVSHFHRKCSPTINLQSAQSYSRKTRQGRQDDVELKMRHLRVHRM